MSRYDGKIKPREFVINLYTFIHIAKIWCFEQGYDIKIEATDISILKRDNRENCFVTVWDKNTTHDPFCIKYAIETIEWVCSEVQSLPQNVAGEK